VTGPRPWRDILDAIAAVPGLDELGPTLAPAWIATLATPAVVCTPVRRFKDRGSSVRWELALQVIVSIQGDDDEPMHALLELCLAALPPGVIEGETIYGQDDRGGATYVVSTTTLNV
jgi:hypothetical protein